MKKKSKRAYLKRKKEFRYHNVEKINRVGKKIKTMHPAYVFLKKGNLFIYVSITHSNNIKGQIVIQLRKNPNPKDNKKSYYVKEIRIDTKDRFGRIKENWLIDAQDDSDIREFFKETKKDDSADHTD